MVSAVLCKQLLLVVAVVVGTGYCQSCSPHTASDLETVLEYIIQSGDASTVPVINLMNFNVVCRTFSQEEDLLNKVSVVVEYTCSGHSNCPSGTVREQIESDCRSGSWNNSELGITNTTLTRRTTPIATLSTTAREDCNDCVSPTAAAESVITPDPVTHCVACHSACVGLMRCFDDGAVDCCNYYYSGMCVTECPSPFIPNSDNICACPEGLTGSNCEIDVICPVLTFPVNGAIDSINRTFNTVVAYSCSEGYILTGDSTRTCLRTGVWSGSDPTCTVVDCGELMAPENGAVSTAISTTFSSIAAYSCNDGYYVEGVSTRTCLASGSWSDRAPTCSKNSTPSLSLGVIVAIIVGGIVTVALVLMLVVVLVLVILWRTKPKESGVEGEECRTNIVTDANVAYGQANTGDIDLDENVAYNTSIKFENNDTTLDQSGPSTIETADNVAYGSSGQVQTASTSGNDASNPAEDENTGADDVTPYAIFTTYI